MKKLTESEKAMVVRVVEAVRMEERAMQAGSASWIEGVRSRRAEKTAAIRALTQHMRRLKTQRTMPLHKGLDQLPAMLRKAAELGEEAKEAITAFDLNTETEPEN